MNIFVTSDTHFRHKNIITLGDGRPFNSIEHHDEILIANWNSTVSHNDVVIHMGDAVMGHRDETLSVIDRLNGDVILIPGNHDAVSSVESKARQERFRPLYETHFAAIWPERVEVAGVVMSHYPPAEIPDHGDVDRFAAHRPPLTDDHRLYLHGHSHQLHTHTPLSNGAVAVNIGVDANNWTPVNIENIPEMIEFEREFLRIMAAEVRSP